MFTCTLGKITPGSSEHPPGQLLFPIPQLYSTLYFPCRVATHASMFTALIAAKDSMRGKFDEMISLRVPARYGLLHRLNRLDYINGWRKIRTTAITTSFYSLPHPARETSIRRVSINTANNEPNVVYIFNVKKKEHTANTLCVKFLFSSKLSKVIFPSFAIVVLLLSYHYRQFEYLNICLNI